MREKPMKWFASLLLVFSYSAMAESVDKVYGSCTYELTGNDATSHLFSDFDSLKKSTVYEPFEIRARGSVNLRHRFSRVVPFSDNATEYRKYKVALFDRDQASLAGMFEEYAKDRSSSDPEDLAHTIVPINGVAISSIRYGGRDEVGGAKIKVNVLGTKGGVNDNGDDFKFKRGRAEFKIKYNVWFDYTDLGGNGILGIFSGDVDQKDLDEAETETHKVKVVADCIIYQDEESTDESDRDIQKEEVSDDDSDDESGPVSEFSGTQIRRSSGVQE